MANQQHIEWLLEGVEAWNARRAREDFVPDLEGADIQEAFRVAKMCSNNGRAKLMGINLASSRLTGANFQNANLQGAILAGADLTAANFSNVYANLADFDLCRLEKAILANASFGRATFESSNFSFANLIDSRLVGARLIGAKLDSSICISTDFRGSILVDVSVSKANFSGAYVNSVDLRKLKGLEQKQLNGMLGNNNTQVPEGLALPEHWLKIDPKTKSTDDFLRHLIMDAETTSFEIDSGDVELRRIREVATKLSSITPIADVKWSQSGLLKAELKPVQPRPRQPIPTPNPEAVVEQLRGVLALSKQLRQQIENSTSPNAAPFIGDAGKIFLALEAELSKDQPELIPVVVKANVVALKAMGPSAEALADTEEAIYAVFIEEADKLLDMLPVLKIIENPYNEEIIPDDAVAPALEVLHDLDEKVNSTEVIEQLGSKLGGVTREAEGFPWESDKQKIANKSSFWMEVGDKLKNPPDSVKGAAHYATIAGAILALIKTLFSIIFFSH